MKIRIWFRPLVWFLKKDWYAKRKLAYNDGEHGQAFDFGAITIVFIKKNYLTFTGLFCIFIKERGAAGMKIHRVNPKRDAKADTPRHDLTRPACHFTFHSFPPLTLRLYGQGETYFDLTNKRRPLHV